MLNQVMKRRPTQMTLQLPAWGGRRAGAGRKPKNGKAGVPHLKRPKIGRNTPVHVTLRLQRELGSLRSRAFLPTLRRCFLDGRQRAGFRVVQFSVQPHHVHLIIEADHALALARGMQGLGTRLAIHVNRLTGYCGTVFEDRYHLHVLRSPRDVRAALAYVLNNHRRHAAQRGDRIVAAISDSFSSGAWFDGWRETLPPGDGPPPVAPALGWLLRVGWRRCGLLDVREVPGRRTRR